MVCICLFIANENPIVDQGFFFFRFFFFHSTTHSNISVYVLSSPYFFCFCWLAGLLRTLQLTTIHLKCQNILHIFFFVMKEWKISKEKKWSLACCEWYQWRQYVRNRNRSLHTWLFSGRVVNFSIFGERTD